MKREQEEYDYGLKRDRARDQEEWKSVAERRELALLEREEMWKGKEVRFAELLKSEERAPKEIERAVQECETEVTERLAVEHGQTLLAVQKEWGAEKALLELRLANLVDQLKNNLETWSRCEPNWIVQQPKRKSLLLLSLPEGSRRIWGR